MRFAIRLRFKAAYELYLKEQRKEDDRVLLEVMDISKERLQKILNEEEDITLDEIAKFLIAYPRVRTDWTILGRGEMLVNDEAETSYNYTTINNGNVSTNSHNIDSPISENEYKIIEINNQSWERVVHQKDKMIDYQKTVIEFLKKELREEKEKPNKNS